MLDREATERCDRDLRFVIFRGFNCPPIKFSECHDGKPGGSLVAVYKGLILGKRPHKRGCLLKEILVQVFTTERCLRRENR